MSLGFVVPVYNVARYLPAFLASLDGQEGGLGDLEIVFVDDGSSDDSATLISDWIAARSAAATLVSKPNGGLASARNQGLDSINADWISFPDPDDELSPNYLTAVRACLASDLGDRANIVAANLLVLDDATGTITNTHPLRAKFARGQRLWELDRQPQYIHLQAASAFYRREVVERDGLRFDPAVRPNFEDGVFTTLYLMNFDAPRLAVVPAAEYRYRQRRDGSSLVQASWSNPLKYSAIPEHGWLAMLRTVHAQLGHVPEWVQNVVLYDLAFFLRTDARSNSPTPGLPSAVVDRFHELLREVLAYIEVSTIEAFKITWLSDDMRAFLVLGVKQQRQRPQTVWIDKIDTGRRLARVRYYFAGTLPDEEWFARGYAVDPVFHKTRAVRFYGRDLVWQRIVWLPANGTLSLHHDHAAVPLTIGPEQPPLYGAGPWAMWTELCETEPPPSTGPKKLKRTPRARAGRLKRRAAAKAQEIAEFDYARLQMSTKTRALRGLAASPVIRSRYHAAWLFIDRDTQAQDNAERLYRWVRANRPEINAWFVLSSSSPDWNRLRDDGFRLIDHFSNEHVLALLNCEHVISSQIDHYIVAPLPARWYGEPTWRYTFLQHGVTKDDLSPWINGKNVDLMITATPDEHRSIVADGTPYRVTGHEVQMTGFPRHDRLLELASQHPAGKRRFILVTPTWRRGLLHETTGVGNRRHLREDFWDSHYAVEWRKVIESERMAAIADAAGCEVVFIPHPNMQDYLIESPLPPHIEVRRFEQIDIQQMLAEAVMLITDYSSMAFEMAYIERPVAYFQFDRDEFFNGGHAYRQGEWSYEHDGFGPVLESAEDTIDAVEQILVRGGAEPVYAERIERTFPLRDGRCCERTFNAISALTRPMPDSQTYLRRAPAALDGRA